MSRRVSRQQADLELHTDGRVYVTLVRKYRGMRSPACPYELTQGGVNPSVIRHMNGDETVLTRKGERGEMRHGSIGAFDE